MGLRRPMLSALILMLTVSCSIEIQSPPPHLKQEPHVVALQQGTGNAQLPDTLYVQPVEQKKSKSRLKRAARFALKAAVLVGGTYAAVKLGEDNLKWRKNEAGEKVWPFVKKK